VNESIIMGENEEQTRVVLCCVEERSEMNAPGKRFTHQVPVGSWWWLQLLPVQPPPPVGEYNQCVALSECVKVCVCMYNKDSQLACIDMPLSMPLVTPHFRDGVLFDHTTLARSLV
jgi:hypothetical protein